MQDKRIKSKLGRFIALIPAAPATGFAVVVTDAGVNNFIQGWPCSKLTWGRPIRFEFASNGDLIDVINTSRDGEALVALSQDAQAFGEKALATLMEVK